MVAAALRQAFIQLNRTQASATLRHFANQLREKWPKLAVFIDGSEVDVLSWISRSNTVANCTARIGLSASTRR